MVIVRKKGKEKEETKTVLVSEIPKKVLVRVHRENMTLEGFAKYDGHIVHCNKLGLSFIPDQSYKPRITYFKGKAYVTFDVTDKGKPLTYKIDHDTLKFEKKDVDAQFVQSIVSSNIFSQLFSKLRGIDIGSLMLGAGSGMFVIIFILFFILPIIGIPVSVGQRPIVVNVPQQAPLPPSGNWTLPMP